MNSPKPFNPSNGTYDEKTLRADKPKGGKLALNGFRFFPSYFVPVAFVAKDWSVTPRRIRALLAAGRLEGRLQDNGYWEVLYPYSFTFGTRGPSLKRQQRPPKRPKKQELKAA
jgi:hypothetical protein